MKLPRNIWVNGRLVDPRKPAVSAFDRGFLYGDGVYETFRVYRGKIFHFDDHFRRFLRSARGVNISIPFPKENIFSGAASLLKVNSLTEAVLRVTLTRGPGPLGFDPRPCSSSTLLMIAVPPPEHPEVLYRKGAVLAVASVRRNPKSSLDPALKSTNNLNNIFGKMEALRRRAYEALMLNTDGFLAEGTISNVFFAAGGRLKTPSLDCGILAGVTRDLVIRSARRSGMTVDEGRFRVGDLFRAEEVFITSTTLEVMPVTTLVDAAGRRRAVGKGAVGRATSLLMAAYKRLVEKETGAR